MGVPAVLRHSNRQRLLIITYHGLRARPAPPGTSWSLLPIAELDRQLRYLRRRYRLSSLDDALAELDAGALSRPTACITFDDGYRSNLEVGREVLERYEAPATIYLATGLIGTDRLIWTIELDLAFQQTRASRLDLRPLGLDIVEAGSVEHRALLARSVIGKLKYASPDARDGLLNGVRDTLGVPAPAHDGAYSFMTWEEVRRFEATGLVRFGAHTVNHEIVARLDDTLLDQEIGESIRAVAAHTCRPSRTFAYPNGTQRDFDGRAEAALARHGVTAAVTTLEGLNDPTTNRFRLRRFNIGSDMTIDEFRLLTAGALRRRTRESS